MASIDTATLPQYLHSNDMMDRFLDAAHSDGKNIARSERSGDNRLNVVTNAELKHDALDYFLVNKAKLEVEFFKDLVDQVGARKAKRFVRIISTHWFDGRSERKNSIVQGLKSAIACYFVASGADPKMLVTNPAPLPVKPFFFGVDDIRKILQINHSLLYKHLQCWVDLHPNRDDLSRGSIYFRRGVNLKNVWPDGYTYIEWDYINSYTLSISTSEQFSAMGGKEGAVLVSADCDYFDQKVLFFSPFIPGMPGNQLELGVIPSKNPPRLRCHGEHAGIHEFLIT